MNPHRSTGHDSAAPEEQASRRLAHEMSNLLDGSMRHLSLALRKLEAGAPGTPGAPETAADEQHDQLVERLQLTNGSLRQMALMLRQWMRGGAVDLCAPEGLAATVREAVGHAVALLAPTAEAHEITIETDLDEPVAASPAGPLFSVIVNGLKNAVEAIGARGHVWITATQQGGRAMLWIDDDGPGLDDSLPRDPDGAVAIDGTTKPTGTGLGLRICRDVMDRMAGELRIEPRPEGGTRLIAAWPLAAKG